MRVVRSLVLGMVALMTAAACSGKDPYSPGTKLGTFRVSGKLVSSSCGAVPDPWEFDVRLNHEGTMLYWIQGGAPVQGQVAADATTKLEIEATYDVRPADKKRGACAMARKDVLDVALADAASKPTRDPSLTAAFHGALAYTFAPTEGADCEDQLTAVGGGFSALPCEVRYTLSGALKEPPK